MRTRFQFRLRTLLIVVTLFCVGGGGYLRSQKRLIYDRMAIRHAVTSRADGMGFVDLTQPDDRTHQIPWLRKLLGDESIHDIILPIDIDRGYLAQVQQTFPEAEMLAREDGDDGIVIPFDIVRPDYFEFSHKRPRE